MPVKKIEQRDFLLRCWQVFHLNGYHHTSMQDLAQATGLQKAGLYHHYPTKELLMQRVITFAMDEFRGYVLSVATDPSLRMEEKIEKMLRRNKRLATIDRRGCFFANIALETGRDGTFNAPLREALDIWIETAAQVLSEKLPLDAARPAARRMIMEYEGAILFYKVSGDEQILEDFIQRTMLELTGQATFKQKHTEIVH